MKYKVNLYLSPRLLVEANSEEEATQKARNEIFNGHSCNADFEAEAEEIEG